MSTRKLTVTQSERKAIGYALVVALLGGAIFLKPYFALITVSIILAFLFFPVYSWLLQRSKNPGRASMQTFLIATLAIVIPVSLVIVFSVHQIDSLIANADFEKLEQTLTDVTTTFNNLLSDWNIHFDPAQVSKLVEEAVQKIGQSLVSGLPGLFGGFFALLTSVIIFIYIFLSLLKHNSKITGLIATLNPLGKDISGLYMDKMSSMTKATVRGQFIIAFCQGLESAIILSIAGMSDLFFFFLMLLTAVSVIPMGAGIITIPIGVVLILTGQVWQGVLIIANHLLVATNIDNILRPMLVPKEARLDPALMILSVFAGIFYFGFMGIVLGPVIMIVVVTTINIYLEVYRNIEMEHFEPDENSKQNLISRVSSKAKDIFTKD